MSRTPQYRRRSTWRQRFGVCPSTGKVRYPDDIAARLAAATFKRNDRNAIRTYRCHGCGDVHLTSKKK